MEQYILAIDQGTSSTKTIIFNAEGEVVSRASVPLHTNYFGDGFVEQDPEGIYQNVLDSVKLCLDHFTNMGKDTAQIKACGISNQRETFVLWNKEGVPLSNAVVWQCKRSVDICERLESDKDFSNRINSKTGLLIDPYFSGTKLLWLYENESAVAEAINNGNAYFGTIDTWLLYKFTEGEVYKTDYTNASRTMFFNLKDLNWDKEILKDFGFDNLNLPQVQASSSYFGDTDFNGLLHHKLSITALIGDSHAAAFGEGCFDAGSAKATLGTGCSILMNTGDRLEASANGMVSTICWSTEGQVAYAFEGVIVSCGSPIEWLKNEVGLLQNATEAEDMASSLTDNGGVYLIPAFSGLGAPYWDMKRKGEIKGLTFSSNKNHIVRAALEAIPYQIMDVITAMEKDANISLKELRVNGGITANKFVMQFLADLVQKEVLNIDFPDISALGAAYLAGLKVGVFRDINHLRTVKKHQLTPLSVDKSKVEKAYQGWLKAIANN
ncbi:glycerol kinase GlpK [Pseudoxanthomonas sp. SGD-10]|nr:glycerol kinase GlpK [Pseudoxanthomonas sp. SGD-10]